MITNKILRICVFLVLFCVVAVGVSVISSVTKQEEMTITDYGSAITLAFILWLFYLFSGKLNK